MHVLIDLWKSSGFMAIDRRQVIMLLIACFLIILAIKKKYEPLLLLPIAFGMILTNLPLANLMNPPTGGEPGGLLWYLYQGIESDIYPPLIFLGVGAMTDFGPLLANPSSIFMGAGAQFGVFFAFMCAVLLFDFSPQEAAAIGIIGGADGPTAIFLSSKLAKELVGPIAVAAYSYMALVPMIQPPIMKLLTTKEERMVKMGQLRQVKKIEKIIFPIVVAVVVILLLPPVASLIGMLMLGNLFRESGVVGRLSDTAQNALINIITIFLGLTVGATAKAEIFLQPRTMGIIILGMVAFGISTAAGVLIGKIMYKLSGGKINPLIGAAGVSAVPMAARVAQKVGQEENPGNFLLMNAMGPNVAGVIGTAVAAGILLKLFG
ncbi:glutaconyl-CoA decarboxylase subunit beta [Clostridium tepidiprofundi DSM 19306]|uniref:Glutaconyl-CoA decarboxylase subunit beta n=1 Tax=Clostridium tepidiprofundi DSM 19306 TaxID=1121338 RepID=A0A151B387_9CLOT|nr:sodium ion-translocating decarboxylase subunit beta [Clostridium tepidiprofundi]KYH34384.1 glutaconyl-CoA decarboxylase subunit beta [Clostridium tepidiprofundi DSM 19306]